MAGQVIPISAIEEPKSFQNIIDIYLTQRTATSLLRLSLALVFIWFGMLKVANASPVVDLLRHSFPIFSHPPFLELLGLGEVFIGIGLAVERFSKYAALLMVMHMLGTLSVALISPSLVFAPVFPVLTMEGEFILKNFVLITAGLAVACQRKND